MEIRLRWLSRLASPLIAMSVRKEDREDSARLKEILETSITTTNETGT